MSTFILSLSDPRAVLENVGGKGMSLARLSRAGVSVPAGFHITTEAYRRFIDENGLQTGILAALRSMDAADPAQAETASAAIGGLFENAAIPRDLAEEIGKAYTELCSRNIHIKGDQAVAIRSSATAEDLPEASFAGQQETYLNIRGVSAVLEAVKKCWASLWTARAIAYRARQGIAPDSVALAVVVQELVCAEAAGVMFTADPVNGRRDKMIITAAWGLGEAIVSGSVTPDTLTIDKTSNKLVLRETAEKLVMTVRTESGTREVPVPDPKKKKPVLNGSQAQKLAGLGLEIDKLYGMPMDIEWTLADGKFAIVQARPITALPPQPSEESQSALKWPLPHPKAMLARGSFAEFVPEPVSPLFATLAVPIARNASQKLMSDMGMADENSYLFTVINDYVYVGFIFTPRMTWKMLTATLGMTFSVVKTAAARDEAAREKYLGTVQEWQARELSALAPSQLLTGASEIFKATAEYYTVAQSGPIPASMLCETVFSGFYKMLVKRKSDPEAPRFLFGLENKALRAEKALYDLAIWSRGYPELESYLSRTPAEEICAAVKPGLAQDPALKEFSERFNAYLKQFGHAIYDLDFAKPVPADSPEPLVETLKVYLGGKNNPYERQQEALRQCEQASGSIARRLDPLRRKYFLKLLKWAQDTAPLRENCIADLGLGYPQLHLMLGELGQRLATGGAIASAEDIYWLELQEAEALAAQLERGESLKCHVTDVEQRKAKWQAMRHITPPSALPKQGWMKAFFPNEDQAGAAIKGFGASAGKVTARACVMLGPEDFSKMQPGDVIVAGITTPAWTPLFARAAAIVTDIGGPLSHSSIVAREYGIPAVLATGIGTRRIRDGQTITVDGGAGRVYLGSA